MCDIGYEDSQTSDSLRVIEELQTHGLAQMIGLARKVSSLSAYQMSQK